MGTTKTTNAMRRGIWMLNLLVLACVALVWPPRACARDVAGSLSWQGYTRAYRVHLPDRAVRGPMPMLLVLHGGGSTAAGMGRLTFGAFDQLADIYGAVVVYPDAYANHWNDGRHMNEASSRLNIDDVGFLRQLIETLAARLPIDRQRVFSCGISNGGQMSFRLAIDLSSHVRGIASVAMNLGRHQLAARPARPVSLLMIPGTADPLVPFGGGQVVVFGQERGPVLPAIDTVKTWVSWMGCDPRPRASAIADLDRADGTRAARIDHAAGAPGARVSMITVMNGGHCWPGGQQYLPTWLIGRTSRDFNACWAIWEFFGLNRLGR